MRPQKRICNGTIQTRVYTIILLLCGCIPVARTFNASLICAYTPNLTAKQRELCVQVPDVMVVMNEVRRIFEQECSWQFKTSRWNCTGVTPPIYENIQMEEGPESAFVYALTSAITVQKIAEACYEYRLGNYCSPDNSRVGKKSPEGWLWGINYDITAATDFAQRFLDSRDIENSDRHRTNLGIVAKTAIHLHNNAAGRRVVHENSRMRCVCHGFSGSCTHKTCFKDNPSIFKLGDVMKAKYEDALKVTIVPKIGGGVSLRVVGQRREQEGAPSATDLVYIAMSANHCLVDPEYTTSRYCMPGAVLTPELGKFYPPCEVFCCTGDFQSEQKTVRQSCDCYFEFCCRLRCNTCEDTYTEYRCSGFANSTSNTSTYT